MKLIRIEEFANRYFDAACKPTLRTVRYWCEQGELPARRIGKPWYVDIDLFERTHDGVLLDRIRTGGRSDGENARCQKP